MATKNRWNPAAIKDLRRRYGETQEKFCKRLGVPVQRLRHWEQVTGAPVGPARVLLDRLAEDSLAKSIET